MNNNLKIFRFLSILCIVMISSCTDLRVPKDSTSIDEAVDPTVWVFFMAGQSNMAGRGEIEPQDRVSNERIISLNKENNWVQAQEPLHFYEPAAAGLDCGMSFAEELLKHVPENITIALVPCAVGGSSIYQWVNDEEHRGVRLLSNFNQKVILAKNKGLIKGVIWHQGERNANEEDLAGYEDALLGLFSEFRNVFHDPNIPIVMGELGSFAVPEQKAFYFEQINAILRKVAENHGNLLYVSSQGLDHRGDNLHFNSSAQREIGRRYAKVMANHLELN